MIAYGNMMVRQAVAYRRFLTESKKFTREQVLAMDINELGRAVRSVGGYRDWAAAANMTMNGTW